MSPNWIFKTSAPWPWPVVGAEEVALEVRYAICKGEEPRGVPGEVRRRRCCRRGRTAAAKVCCFHISETRVLRRRLIGCLDAEALGLAERVGKDAPRITPGVGRPDKRRAAGPVPRITRDVDAPGRLDRLEARSGESEGEGQELGDAHGGSWFVRPLEPPYPQIKKKRIKEGSVA